jgi:cytosolic carboxypeptidase protein 2/3
MILKENKQKRVRMFIDMHGHSRKKNVFFYGCCQENQNLQDNFFPKAFPFLMSKIHEPYNYHDCSFTIQPDKEGTARVALWD